MEDAKSISGVHDLVSLSDPAKSDVRNLSNWKIVKRKLLRWKALLHERAIAGVW